jgi:GntR family transcriptional regulator of arabinose operon
MLSPSPKLPKYTAIARQLRAQIEEGAFKPGERLPSFIELQAQFDISPATVERIYSLLEQENLVVRKHGSGTFVAESSRAGVVGISGVSSRAHPYWSHLMHGLYSVANQAGIELLLLTDTSVINPDKVDGILLSETNEEAAQQLLKRLPPGVPCVSILFSTPGAMSVLTDDAQGVSELTRHLLALGHRHISYLFDPVGQSRLLGYRSALSSAGIEPLECWTRTLQPYKHEDKVPDPDFRVLGHSVMRRWLKEGWAELGCTALMAHNDDTAIGAIEALQEAGFRVPEQISVTGFDGTEIGKRFYPSLMSVEVPLEEIGATAMDLLLRQIRGGNLKASTLLLPTKMVFGNSVSPVLSGTESSEKTSSLVHTAQ